MKLCSMLCATLDERGTWGRMDACTCFVEFLCCSPETTTTLLIGYSPIQNKKFTAWGEMNMWTILHKLHYCSIISSDQIRSVAQSCPTLCDPMNSSTPGLPVQHQLPEITETHVHHVHNKPHWIRTYSLQAHEQHSPTAQVGRNFTF